MIVYVGTNTGENKAKGLGVFEMDETSGALTHLQTVEAENPTFLCVHPSGKYLYAATRGRSGGEHVRSFIEAFAIDASTKRLTPLNMQPSGGESPAHVSVHQSGRVVFAANFASGHVASLPVHEDGSLGEAASVILHEGGSVGAHGRPGPHAHFITPDPSGERALACDLGCDRVFVYRVDAERATLTPNEIPFAQVNSGAGPRHLAFHPKGHLVFVINQLDATLSSFAYDQERGALEIRDTWSTVPEGYAGENNTAQVVAHPSGKFVYGSNRGHDSIAIFEVDEERGKVAPRGHVATQGRSPRNFNIDPAGRLLLAANERSHTIVPFRIDEESGGLEPTGSVTETPAPTCIQFLG